MHSSLKRSSVRTMPIESEVQSSFADEHDLLVTIVVYSQIAYKLLVSENYFLWYVTMESSEEQVVK